MAPPVRHTAVTIRGQVFASPLDAARAMGVSRSAIYRAIREGTLDTVGLGQGFRRRLTPVVIRGVTYASVGDAARALAVTKSAVWSAINSGDPDRVGRRPPMPKTALPTTLGGVTWPSRKAAAAWLRVSKRTVTRLLSGGSAPQIGIASQFDAEGIAARLMRMDAEAGRQRREARDGKRLSQMWAGSERGGAG